MKTMTALCLVSFIIAPALGTAGCGDGGGGEDTATDDALHDPDTADTQAEDAIADEAGEADMPVDDAPAEEAAGEAPDLEVAEEDVTGSGDTQPYGQCSTTEECQPGFTCETFRDNPLYGQCTRTCAGDGDCPAAPVESTVGCNPESDMCLILCGIHGGTCPDWLECVALEMCYEKVSTVPDKTPGELCTDTAECEGEAECVALGDNPAYCAPLCTSDPDCTEAAGPEYTGTCQSAGAFSFCMYNCSPTIPCPGDLTCVVLLCLTGTG